MPGKEHLSTLASMINLAKVLNSQGKYEKGQRDASTSTGVIRDVAGQGASCYTEEHEQSGLDAEQARQIWRGRRDISTIIGADGKGAGEGASIYADERLLSCLFAAPQETV